MSTTTNTAATLLNIESLVNSHDSKLSILQKELKIQKEMLNNLLENNEEYAVALQEATKFNKQKTIAKQKVLKSTAAAPIVDKLKDGQAQVKELKVALSDYLSQYVNLSGTNKIEGLDGIIRQIVYTARLTKTQD